MILNVIFSFNRVMQLDYLLQSFLKRFKTDSKVVILYHTTGAHKQGYDLLKKKYSGYKNISFVERKHVLFDLSYRHALNTKRDWEFFKERNLFKKNGDNFKGALQKIIRTSGCEFVMFNTDDSIFFEDVEIPDEILNIIRSNPENTSYRLYVGENLEGQPDYVEKKSNYYQWDYYADTNFHHWSYPFAVDGTIYHSEALLKHMKPMVYHNPVTLEHNGYSYIRYRKLFRTGMSPITSKLVATKLNRVSVDSLNPTLHIQPDFLNEKFVDGYTLDLVIPEHIDNSNIVPSEIYLIKGEIREQIYSMNEEGKKVQSLLGIEGAKEQLD
ncbi:hypothetical protein [Chryseobacterium vrystaatense]|uniref:Uncharacterized protein n=1 Tax=Chryseobacterium vrystaatense TaxID=307480 RepID=A0A1M4VTZ3_9FLAO|nr:hypothetical protein [Chryseobacterium vrystaatense]SHE72398.1 hypothetical protein SAMN02787073_0982 [Chryseobacterium vrystaatense]